MHVTYMYNHACRTTQHKLESVGVCLAEPVTVTSEAAGGTVNPASVVAPPQPASAVERPRASVDMLNRQASFRGFNKLQDNSPFKRNQSLRLNELPSELARQKQLRQFGHAGHSLDSTDAAGGSNDWSVLPPVLQPQRSFKHNFHLIRRRVYCYM